MACIFSLRSRGVWRVEEGQGGGGVSSSSGTEDLFSCWTCVRVLAVVGREENQAQLPFRAGSSVGMRHQSAPVPAPDHELAADFPGTSPPGAGIRAERILCLIPGARTASFQPSALFFLRCWSPGRGGSFCRCWDVTRAASPPGQAAGQGGEEPPVAELGWMRQADPPSAARQQEGMSRAHGEGRQALSSAHGKVCARLGLTLSCLQGCAACWLRSGMSLEGYETNTVWQFLSFSGGAKVWFVVVSLFCASWGG